MNILESWSLNEGIKIAIVDEFQNDVYMKQLNENLMDEYPFLQWQKELSDNEEDKLKQLGQTQKDNYKLRIALLKNDELIGWSFGWMESPTTFFMGASIVLKEYRKNGYYSMMVQKVFEITKEIGFQSVSSFHVATNNPIIIAKLKLGFTITGIQLDATHGILVKLVYNHNELLNRATKFRAGAIGEDKVLKLLQEHKF
jgi:ribosomal protein S18 acetylase RimI-like enzyme